MKPSSNTLKEVDPLSLLYYFCSSSLSESPSYCFITQVILSIAQSEDQKNLFCAEHLCRKSLRHKCLHGRTESQLKVKK